MVDVFALGRQAEITYQALRSSKQRWRHPHVAYRCRNGCLLLHVVETPVGTLVHHPSYHLSPTRNAARSSPEGRAANTIDGDRQWREWTSPIDSTGISPKLADVGSVGVQLDCDHVSEILTPVDFAAHWAQRPVQYIVRNDPLEYAVSQPN